MSSSDEFPPGPEIAESLEAIDATLAGEPVDPSHAELAELALMLASDRPQMNAAVARELDDLVKGRFAKTKGARRRRRWTVAPAASLALAASVAVVLVLSAGGSGGSSSASTPDLAAAPAIHRGPSSRAGPASSASASSTTGAPSSASASSTTGAPSSAATSQAPVPNAVPPASPTPPDNGRKIIQSSSLALSTAPSRVDSVAQQVFEVIGAQKGIVSHSTVTATGGSDGYAEFQLSVPSANLAPTMAELSQLQGANVVSRTDSTQDVNDQFVADSRRLADAKALRASLVKQLANAVTTEQVDSLTAQINQAEGSISRDAAALRTLDQQVGYSPITLSINATALPLSSGSSFTIGKAAHDAERVLMVTAGVALIGLAALVPVCLLGAMAWWTATASRRRRRERALDLA